jgi:hypothetical protein
MAPMVLIRHLVLSWQQGVGWGQAPPAAMHGLRDAGWLGWQQQAHGTHGCDWSMYGGVDSGRQCTAACI